MSKRMCLFILALAVMLAAGCGMSLPEGMKQDQLNAQAETVMNLINSRDYAGVYDMMRADVQGMTSPEQLQQLLDPVLDELGALTEISGMASTGQKAEDTEEKYALVVVACKYENGRQSYNLAFDADLKLIGLYAK